MCSKKPIIRRECGKLSPLREESAQRTRVQIREAAARLFVRQGYGGTSMREISEEAHVSERTTYLAYPSKLELLLEVIGVATTGDDDPTPLADRPEFQAAVSEHDGKRALELEGLVHVDAARASWPGGDGGLRVDRHR
jgi:AcrR family transcriptional regulator